MKWCANTISNFYFLLPKYLKIFLKVLHLESSSLYPFPIHIFLHFDYKQSWRSLARNLNALIFNNYFSLTYSVVLSSTMAFLIQINVFFHPCSSSFEDYFLFFKNFAVCISFIYLFILHNTNFQNHLEKVQEWCYLILIQIMLTHFSGVVYIIFNYPQLHYHSAWLFILLKFTTLLVLGKVVVFW